MIYRFKIGVFRVVERKTGNSALNLSSGRRKSAGKWPERPGFIEKIEEFKARTNLIEDTGWNRWKFGRDKAQRMKNRRKELSSMGNK